jgi:hypothetical protein
VPDPHDDDIATVRNRVEALLRQGRNVYQPLYNVPFVPSIAPLRPCVDRCRAVEAAMGGQTTGRRLWDAGCSLGYNTLYFVDRGMVGHGTDIDPRNVAICQEVRRFTPGTATFALAELSSDAVEALAPGDYDVMFIFNVLHHIVERRGLDHVQGMMRILTERVPVLFVELALRSETPPPGYSWAGHLPEDELAIFGTSGALDIDLVGRFPTHVGPVLRPLYRVAARRQP